LLPIFSWFLFANTKIENAPKGNFSHFKVRAIRVYRRTFDLIHAVPDKSQIPMTKQDQTKPKCIIFFEVFNIQQKNDQCSDTRHTQIFADKLGETTTQPKAIAHSPKSNCNNANWTLSRFTIIIIIPFTKRQSRLAHPETS
jgi:hypothetical protein